MQFRSGSTGPRQSSMAARKGRGSSLSFRLVPGEHLSPLQDVIGEFDSRRSGREYLRTIASRSLSGDSGTNAAFVDFVRSSILSLR